MRVLLGTALGAHSPLAHPSRPLLLEILLEAGAQFELPFAEERALCVIEGEISIGAQRCGVDQLLVFKRDAGVRVQAQQPSRLLLLGGPPLEGRRFIDWNFVSSSRERIERAKADWQARRFPTIPGDEVEFIPLPSAPKSPETITVIDCESEKPGDYPQTLRVRTHSLRADVGPAEGSQDSAPSPHDYFDASLAACKTLTATWYAKRNNIPLERVESHVERDASQERKGIYRLIVRLKFHGPLSDEQRAKLLDVATRCPVHKLMTTTDVQIETTHL